MIVEETSGAIAIERCVACHGAALHHRGFCARCGSRAIEIVSTSAVGRVIASSQVHISAAERVVDQLPFCLVLVRLDALSDIVIMAVGADTLAIGAACHVTAKPSAVGAPYLATGIAHV